MDMHNIGALIIPTAISLVAISFMINDAANKVDLKTFTISMSVASLSAAVVSSIWLSPAVCFGMFGCLLITWVTQFVLFHKTRDRSVPLIVAGIQSTRLVLTVIASWIYFGKLKSIQYIGMAILLIGGGVIKLGE